MDDRQALVSTLSRRLVVDVLTPMKRAFVGKDEVIDLLGLALVAGENVFLLGPPGTAKSALVKDLARRLDGRAFDYLLTRFTEPSELFGPFDIRRLREGELATNTEGMLPEADLVFLDELLNANSAILNSLLGALNERVLRRGRETLRLPMLLAVGASNHLPEDESLAALFDRFLVRVRCENVDDERLPDVLEAGWRLERDHDPASRRLAVDDIRQIRGGLLAVDLAPALEKLVALVRRLRAAGFALSDRRCVKLQRLVAASALLAGRSSADPTDLWVFRYIWDTQEQQEILTAVVDEVLAHVESANAHPRARASAAPDPETLAADLEEISRRLTVDASLSSVSAAQLRDHLGILAARCQWVIDDKQRTWLQSQVDALFVRVGAAT
jgi:MoxR-like ATPase